MRQHFTVVGITSNTRIYAQYEGYTYIPKEKILNNQFDFVVVMAQGKILNEICAEAVSLGILEEKILPCRVFGYSDFDVDRYCNLRKNTPTIFSNSCWGGVTYHSLGLPFCSPLINAWESDKDYINLLSNPERYFNETLKQVGTGISEGIAYPICACGDIKIHFNHVSSFEKANADWEKRKQRINWNNILVEMHTTDKEEAEKFSRLPYKKKVCFVPFKSNDPSLVYLDFCDMDEMKEVPLWKMVIGMARGAYPYYDVFTLLEMGRVEKTAVFLQ